MTVCSHFRSYPIHTSLQLPAPQQRSKYADGCPYHLALSRSLFLATPSVGGWFRKRISFVWTSLRNGEFWILLEICIILTRVFYSCHSGTSCIAIILNCAHVSVLYKHPRIIEQFFYNFTQQMHKIITRFTKMFLILTILNSYTFRTFLVHHQGAH